MSLADQSQRWFPTSVQVTVLQARGLRVKGKNGTNDAYAVMQVAKDKFATSVVEKSVAPMWKEEATFDLPLFHRGNAERCTLHVHVMHRALVGPDKLLGQAVINLLELNDVKSRNNTEWFKLLDKAGKPDKDRGEVLLDIQFMRNNMTASMFDLSATDKHRSRLGKFKDKVRGKKKEGISDTASAIVPSFTQVLTDSEEEGDEGGGAEWGAEREEKKKKHKLKSLFSPKSNLQKNMSQSMSVLGPLPEKNSSLSGSRSSGLNVDSSEGKKKFKFMIHKRSGSSDSKGSQGPLSLLRRQKQGSAPAVEQSNVCINGSHVYSEEPQPRTSRIGSTFSLASSGLGSMEELRRVQGSEGSGHSPWTEEEDSSKTAEEEVMEEEEAAEVERRRRKEEEEEEDELKRLSEKDENERSRKIEEDERIAHEQWEKNRLEEEERIQQERKRIEEEEKIRMDEEERVRKEVEEMKRLEEQERMRMEEERKRREEEEERVRMEEEDRIRMEEERKTREEEDERVRKEEQARITMEEERKRREEEEERFRMEEEDRIRMEEERKRREEEEERVRMEEEDRIRMEEERKRREEEEERFRMEEEDRIRMEEERVRMEEKDRIRMGEERKRREEEEERVRMEEEDRIRMGEERKRREEEEERVGMEEEDRIRMEEERKRNEEEEERVRMEEEDRIRMEEERKRREEEEERVRMEEEDRIRTGEERKRREEEDERVRKEEQAIIRMEEERKRREEEEERVRMEEEDRIRMEEERKRREEEEERVRMEEEDRIRMERKRREEEEERVKMEEEDRIRMEEDRKRREEEEERVRMEEEDRIRMEEERKMREEEEERVRKEEKDRIRMEEERKRREEEEERRRKEEEDSLRRETERKMLKEEEEKLQKEEERLRIEEEERRLRDEKDRLKRVEEENRLRKEDEETEMRRLKEKTSKIDEQTDVEMAHEPDRTGLVDETPIDQKIIVSVDSSASFAELASTNLFDDMASNDRVEEIPGSISRTAKVSAVKPRYHSAVPLLGNKEELSLKGSTCTSRKEPASTQRDKRPAPQPPRGYRTQRQIQREQNVPTVAQQRGGKEAKTYSVFSQRLMQTIAPLNRSSSTRKDIQVLENQSSTHCSNQLEHIPSTTGPSKAVKHNKGPAPSRPHSSTAGVKIPTQTADGGPLCEPKHVLSSAANRKDAKIPQEHDSAAKQVPVAFARYSFEDNGAEIQLTDQNEITPSTPNSLDSRNNHSRPSAHAGSPELRAALPQIPEEDCSQTKNKSSKAVHAPLPPPVKKAATSSMLINQGKGLASKRQGSGTDVALLDNRIKQPPCPAQSSSSPAKPKELSGTRGDDPQSDPISLVSGEVLLVNWQPSETQPLAAQSTEEEAGGKQDGSASTSRRRHPVRPLSPLEHQSASNIQGIEHQPTAVPGGAKAKIKVNEGDPKGPYSQLTQEELISLLLKQRSQLSERDKKITELEQYIDNLLVRVIEEKPSILMSLSSLKKGL